MIEVRAGSTGTLLSQWYDHPGGPAADVDDLTLTIAPSGGGTPVLGPTSTGIVREAAGLYSYLWAVSADLPAGVYIATWSAAGGLTAVEPVAVLDAGTGRVYATSADLAAYPVAVPSGWSAGLLLLRASRDVDRALLTAVYATDSTGLPTDPVLQQALRDAVCEQVAAMVATGDRTGLGIGGPASFTIGKLSVQGANSRSAPRTGGLVDQAYAALQAAGLTGHAVQGW